MSLLISGIVLLAVASALTYNVHATPHAYHHATSFYVPQAGRSALADASRGIVSTSDVVSESGLPYKVYNPYIRLSGAGLYESEAPVSGESWTRPMQQPIMQQQPINSRAEPSSPEQPSPSYHEQVVRQRLEELHKQALDLAEEAAVLSGQRHLSQEQLQKWHQLQQQQALLSQSRSRLGRRPGAIDYVHFTINAAGEEEQLYDLPLSASQANQTRPGGPPGQGQQPQKPPEPPATCEKEQYFCQVYKLCYPCFANQSLPTCKACEAVFKCQDENCAKQKSCELCKLLPAEGKPPVCEASGTC